MPDPVSEPASSEPEPSPAPAVSGRPDVAAQKEAVSKFNEDLAGWLRDFISEGGGWFDAQPSSVIFDRFQEWCVAKSGAPMGAVTKNRISKVLVELLGATWHKTGKGRLYLLPAGLRPAAPPAGEEERTVPVVPPASTPRVQDGDNVVQLRGRNAAALSPESEELAARTESATPAAAPFVDLPEFGNGSDVEVRAEGAFDASSGERLPGDGEPSPVEAALLALAAAPPAAVDAGDEPDPDRLCNSCVLPYGHGGPHGAAWNPSDDLPAAEGASVVLEEPLRNVQVQPDGSVTAEGTFPAAVAEQVAAGAVPGLSVGPVDFGAMLAAAEEADEEPAVPGPIEASLVADGAAPPLPEGAPASARLFSVKLDHEQVRWPLRDLTRVFDSKLPAGTVRLVPLEEACLRMIPSGPYCTCWVAPAADVAAPALVDEGPAAVEEAAAAPLPAADVVPAPGYGAAIPDPAIREAVAVGEAAVAADAAAAVAGPAEWTYVVPLSPVEAELPFGALEALWLAQLPSGAAPRGIPVELITDAATGGPAVSGRVLGGAEEVPTPAVDVEAPAEVSGEALQALVVEEPAVDYEAEEAEYEAGLAAPVPNAAAVALAAYRAASAGLSLPDHVADDGDWG